MTWTSSSSSWLVISSLLLSLQASSVFSVSRRPPVLLRKMKIDFRKSTPLMLWTKENISDQKNNLSRTIDKRSKCWSVHVCVRERIRFFLYLQSWDKRTGGGRNVKFHYYDWPFFSLHQKWLFSWSLLCHHNIENGFLVDHYYDITTTTKKRLSMLWFYLWHQ